MTGIRYPQELIEAIDRAGRSRTDGAIRMVDMANDATTELGDTWTEISVYAYREQITEGQALGRLAQIGLKRSGLRRIL